MPHGFFETSSNSIFDAYQRFSLGRTPSQIIVVNVDDESLRRVGQWPWRRDQLAKMIDVASSARVIGLDILMTEPDRLSPHALLSDLPDITPEIKLAISALPQSDAILAKSFSRVPVVLAAAAGDTGGEEPPAQVPHTPVFESGVDPRPGLPHYRAVAWPLPELVAASRGIGLVSEVAEPDGVTRRMSVVLAAGSELMPSFASEVLRIASRADRIALRSGPTGSRELEIGNHRIEIDTAGRAWPLLGKHMAAQSISAYRLLDGAVDPSVFRDRIVLIGAGAAGLGDVRVTPLRQAEPGIVVQAQFIDSMMSGDVLWRPPLIRVAEVLFGLALGAGALLLLGRVSDRMYAIVFCAMILVAILGSFVAFQIAGLLVDWTFPLSALVVTMLVAFMLRIDDDLQARRRSQQQLSVALLKAESADRAKTEFLANASHELRTPLTAILGFSEIMASQMFGPLSAKYETYARDIHKTATHLFTIINDILDLTVIDLGGRQLTENTFDVADMIADCTHMTLASRSGNDKIRIRSEVATPLLLLRADARMVKQMLINLLSNAIKYSPKGGEIVVRAEIRRDDGGLSIAVVDFGPGIAAADIPYVMQPFGRLNSAKLAQAPGIGIGLPLTKSMIELHGGKLILKSAVGVGTEALLWFPPTRLSAATEMAS